MLVGLQTATSSVSSIPKDLTMANLTMTNSKIYRWRRTTDINRENALFELLEGETALLDVGFTDAGVFEVAFNPAMGGKVMNVDQFWSLLNEGKALAIEDR